MRSEAGALGFTQEALKTSTTDGVSKHLWIPKKTLYVLLEAFWKKKWDFDSGEFSTRAL